MTSAPENLNTPATTKSNSIMIVDDSQVVTRALARIFSSHGFESVQLHSGLEALAYAEGNTPGAAIIDIHLPDLSGLVLTQRLREKWGSELPIIIVSGDHSLAMLNSLPHVGATYFFAKPVNPAMLLEQVKELMA